MTQLHERRDVPGCPGTQRDIDRALRQHLETSARALASFRTLEGHQYQSHEALVLALGRPWIAGPLPDRRLRGPVKQCYWNSLRLARRRKTLRYVEGYAWPILDGRAGIPIHHAWCVDQLDRVWDVTLREPEQAAYYGIAFSLEEIERFRAAVERPSEFSILEMEYLIGAPLLKHGRLFPEEEMHGPR